MAGIFDQILNYSPPLTVSGTVSYKGTWNAATNTPTLNDPPASTTKGDYYVVSAAGTFASISFAVGDWIISNGTGWEKVDLTDAVSSVFGRTGAVVGVSTDYSAVGLTGTAIGASSPSTVAATTITASSTIAASGTVTGSNLSGTNTGNQTITLTGDVTGSGTSSFAATVVTNANLTGDVTSVGNATTLTNAPVIAKVLTGYTSGAGTVAATDSILQAIQKLNGNDATNANLTGAIISTGNATSLGSFSSANLASALTDETGSGANVFATSPTLVTPILGTPQSGTLTSCTGLPISTGVSGLGTGIATALAVNVGTAGAPVVNGGALGTPSSGTVTNLTGTASINTNGAHNGTVGATTPSTGAFTTLSATTPISTASGGNAVDLTVSAPAVIGSYGFRNRIINGDMRIDQANAGAAVTVNSTAPTYGVDQFRGQGTAAAGVFTIQQSTTTPPAGFTHFFRTAITTADAAPAAGSFYLLANAIEGSNVADFQFGAAGARTITLSFWVRSSLTGTFSGSVKNQATRSYLFNFTISAANTWEQKTVTIAGDTTGTWVTDANTGLLLLLDLGSGSTFRGTAGSWNAGSFFGATSAARLISTISATFDITGVQLEVGSAATPFEARDFASELVRCQRYYATSIESGKTITDFATLNTNNVGGIMGYSTGAGGDMFQNLSFPVAMRANPTLIVYSGANRVAGSVRDMVTGADVAGFPNGSNNSSNKGVSYVSGNTLTLGRIYGFHYVANARL